MDTNGDLHTGNSAEPWIEFLDDEIVNADPDTPEHDLPKIFRQALLSENESSPSETAKQIDTYYQETYLPSDPLLRFQDDKGMSGFLNSIYDLVFELATVIPYHHHLQNVLVEFIAALRKLPPKQCKIWDEDHLVYTDEPIFPSVMDEDWNRFFPSDLTKGADLEKSCAEWVNFSAFVARCTQAGLNDQFKYPRKYPSKDIPIGLEKDHAPGVRRNCLIRVAAQYILLCGSKISDGIKDAPTERQRWWADKWQLWAKKLEELADSGEIDPDLKSEVHEAHEKLVALQPQSFNKTES